MKKKYKIKSKIRFEVITVINVDYNTKIGDIVEEETQKAIEMINDGKAKISFVESQSFLTQTNKEI